ncbi:MAG: twin-arginine translocase TatA/TatE family subunit, partial [Verrucomicrobiota bacterium]
MPSFGGQEMIIVFLIVLLLFGAKKLPELARGLGKSMGEFKKARQDFEEEIAKAEADV